MCQVHLFSEEVFNFSYEMINLESSLEFYSNQLNFMNESSKPNIFIRIKDTILNFIRKIINFIKEKIFGKTTSIESKISDTKNTNNTSNSNTTNKNDENNSNSVHRYEAIEKGIANNDVKALREALGSIIYTNRDFSNGEFFKVLNYVESKGIKVKDSELIGKPPITSQKSEFTDEDFARAIFELKKNFCDERIKDVKTIGEKLYGKGNKQKTSTELKDIEIPFSEGKTISIFNSETTNNIIKDAHQVLSTLESYCINISIQILNHI